MVESRKTPVLLLKTKSHKDGYEEYFAQDGRYSTVFVPVLEHRFNDHSLETLAALIKDKAFRRPTPAAARGSSLTYGGLIFTSQRAVEAFVSVVQRLKQEGVDVNDVFEPQLPFYVVGPATARALRELELPCRIIGEETGTGEALADFILANHIGTRSLLFPVGEQRRDIIPNTLQSDELDEQRRIKIEEMTVYETAEMTSFKSDFRHDLADAIKQNSDRQWVVVFSPTGCRAMLQGIGLIDCHGKATEAASAGQARTARIVTIGPTTQAFLRDKLGFEPDAVAPKPSPEGLFEAMNDYT